MKQRLTELRAQPGGTPEVVVVGGGYAGIELASVASEMLAGTYRLVFSSNLVTRGHCDACIHAAKVLGMGAKNIAVHAVAR